ncbi:MAG: DoxX family protein [Xanthomonadales bacterium]|jgi:putative oxidoreductase|nr:DoxX family protein [Xanthomonadales bacterium]MDH3923760.1 DoxX family protein [Xanthomonadales bacterium]MDH3941113.1 DoxX family protein [Xanthomonadales bacterium]MDH4000918.1 DoxX family protein [Xanthomonadales bacterium]
MFDLYDNVTARLKTSGDYLWPLALRLVMFWEFWEAGIKKLRGENWFADIPWADWQKGFPWPFSLVPTDLNWLVATWGELFFSVLILLGLFTRFAALSLLVITVVATAAVHWPAGWSSLGELWNGYVITAKDAGNFKLPLLFVVILLPLVFHGGGKLSVDQLLLKLTGRDSYVGDRIADGIAAALMFAVIGVMTVFLEPAWGIVCFVIAVILGLTPALRR